MRKSCGEQSAANGPDGRGEGRGRHAKGAVFLRAGARACTRPKVEPCASSECLPKCGGGQSGGGDRGRKITSGGSYPPAHFLKAKKAAAGMLPSLLVVARPNS